MANKPGERKQPTLEIRGDMGRMSTKHKPVDRMNLYVNGKHTIQVDAEVAHDVAESYMSQGDSVWLSRAVVKMDGNRPNPQKRARAKRKANK